MIKISWLQITITDINKFINKNILEYNIILGGGGGFAIIVSSHRLLFQQRREEPTTMANRRKITKKFITS